VVSIKAVNSLGKTDGKSERTILKPVMQKIGLWAPKLKKLKSCLFSFRTSLLALTPKPSTMRLSHLLQDLLVQTNVGDMLHASFQLLLEFLLLDISPEALEEGIRNDSSSFLLEHLAQGRC
jgi:hypothetical protein